MYDTVENLSTIQTSSNRIDSDSDTDTGKYSYEYHSHGSTNNSSTIPNKKFSNSAQTDTAHVKQQDKNTQIKPSYEYVTINKKWNKDKIKEKKLDKKDEEKNSNDDNNKNSNESQIPTFLKGVGTTLTTEFIFFIVWSAYYYWHQSIMMAKEKNIEDLKSMNISVEKQMKEVSQNRYPSYGFHTSAKLSGHEDVVNTFELIDFGGQGSYMRFVLYVNQYRLKPEHTKLLAKEMKNLSLSEFNRAREKVESETYMSIGRIDIFGGISGFCENSEVRN